MSFDARWTRIVVDDTRRMLYGPGTGRLYLLGPREAEDETLHRVLGLARSTYADDLDDPAGAVAHAAGSFSGDDAPRSPTKLRAAYRFLDRSRAVLPFAVSARLVSAAARRSRRKRRSAVVAGSPVDAIAAAIHALERDVGYADCYPRALMTAGLALAAGAACRLAIGVLAPTRKMHAWCCVDGVVPFEPMPEHYLYRPLLVISLTP